MSDDVHSDYLIHSGEEMRRLERQAALYRVDEDLARIRPAAGERVLDAGCGSGVLTRAIAAAAPGARVVGLDREVRYLDHARGRAAEDRLTNITFTPGDVAALPFDDATFDIVFSKHLLQWVREPGKAIAEMVRVTRPGGRVVAANFDGFMLQHWPVDERVQADIEAWFTAARERMGFDNWMGRKLGPLFRRAGLTDLVIETMPDRAFSGMGFDAEQRWNMETQWNATLPFWASELGSRQAAEAARDRILARQADPDTYWHCTMFYVQGRVPG